jgi:predicted transcriptional regulator
MIILKDVVTLLNGELLTAGTPLGVQCSKVFASDLMSDVLTSIEPGSLLLTGLANTHVICTCSLADVAAVVFVQGKRPGANVVEQAREKHLPLVATRLPMFEACAQIASLLQERGHVR